VPENVIAASLAAASTRPRKGDPMTLRSGRRAPSRRFYGLQHGAKDALLVAAEVWRGKGEHLEKADVYRGAIEGKAGEIIRTPFKALQVEDALFRTVAERAKAYEMAVDRAVKEGLHPETQEAPRAHRAVHAAPGARPVRQGAGEALARSSRPAPSPSSRSASGRAWRWCRRPCRARPMGFIVPFVRTPANLVSWAIQHVPGLNLMSAAGGTTSRPAASAREGRRARRDRHGPDDHGLRARARTAPHGGGLFDKEEGGTKRAAGWQPYSVKIGDKYYSYQRIEPVAKVLGIAADLIELQHATKDEDKAKIAAMLVLMFGNATVSTTYLSGLSNAIQAVTDPERFGENFLEQYATSVVPKIIGQTVAADPYKREVDGVLDAIQSQLPFLREKLLPKRDVWGEPVANDRWFAVMPIATSEASKDKVKTEAQRLSSRFSRRAEVHAWRRGRSTRRTSA
jgi:hypothetical protein